MSDFPPAQVIIDLLVGADEEAAADLAQVMEEVLALAVKRQRGVEDAMNAAFDARGLGTHYRLWRSGSGTAKALLAELRTHPPRPS